MWRCGHCPTGNLRIIVDAIFNNVSIAAPTFTSTFKITLGKEQTADEYVVAHWDTLKGFFESQAVPDQPSAPLAAQRAALLDATTTAMQNQLRDYQHVLYGQILNAIQSATTLHAAVVELAGGKALLDGYITLGLPRAVANDDLLRALLFGSQRLVDDGLVVEMYARAVSNTSTLTTTSLMTDTRVALGQVAQQRADMLDSLLKQYLDAIGTNTHVEAFSLAADTRMELRVSQRLARLNAQAQRSVYLPLLRR